MKTTITTIEKALAVVMNVKNGTPAGLSALQASILRGKELTK